MPGLEDQNEWNKKISADEKKRIAKANAVQDKADKAAEKQAEKDAKATEAEQKKVDAALKQEAQDIINTAKGAEDDLRKERKSIAELALRKEKDDFLARKTKDRVNAVERSILKCRAQAVTQITKSMLIEAKAKGKCKTDLVNDMVKTSQPVIYKEFMGSRPTASE